MTLEPNSHRLDWLSEIRRQFHTHPELSFEEIETTNRIISILDDLGIPAARLPKSPGAVGLINSNIKGPCIALRADIDALPIQEANAVPYKSVHPKRMHACGHDANTAIMLGVARTLVKNISPLKGQVKFLFQPAEERTHGAKTMISQGVLKNPEVDQIFAGHMAPDLDVGTLGIFKDKGYAAADLFTLTITGHGGHGGRPHETIDPLTAGAHFITSLQTIVARNMNPVDPAVISVGKFQAGDAGNIIPQTALLEGTIRTHSTQARDLILKRIKELVSGIETGFNVNCTLEIEAETPCCTNDEGVSQFLHDTAVQLLGKDKVKWLAPTMGSEDFAYFTLEKPGAIVRLGCRNKKKGIIAPLHSPYFDIDEAVLEIGTQLFHRAVCTALS